jgi:iron complex transport system substrate-binding protein
MNESHEATKAQRDKEEVATIPLGLLINLGAATFKEGCERIVNGPQSFASSWLRVNQGL